MQTDRRALATDEWLRVKGCEDVYALGDCATIDQRKIMVCKICSLFFPFLQLKVTGPVNIIMHYLLKKTTITVYLFCQVNFLFLPSTPVPFFLSPVTTHILFGYNK